MTTTLTTRAQNAAVNAIAAQAVGGSAVYMTEDGTILASLALPTPAFTPAADGAAEANGLPKDVTITATGTVAFCRIRDASGAALADVYVTTDVTAVSGTVMPSPVLTAGEIARVTAITLTIPATDAIEAA